MPRKPADPVRVATGRIAYLSRRDVGDPDKLANAYRDLRAARIERAIQEALDEAPPLTAKQRENLAALLWAGA